MADSILYVDEQGELARLLQSGDLERHDVIVIDVDLEGGFELLDALVSRRIAAPIIVVGTFGDAASVRAAMNRGAFDFVPKPVQREELELAQQRALQHARSARGERPELAALGLLVAGVAHDLKGPLGFISNFTALSRELLGELREQVSADIQAELDAIDETLDKLAGQGRVALEIVGALLAPDSQSETDLNANLTTQVELFASSVRASAPDCGLVVELKLDPAAGKVAISSTKLLSIVINLLENAFHAVRGNRGTVPQIVVETHALGDMVEICVIDNGTGIGPGLHERIFEPFFTTKGPGEGTGLGLHLVRKLANDSSGSVVAEDNQPAGARLRVRLPAPKR
jgi:signal transduction histidine kinase